AAAYLEKPVYQAPTVKVTAPRIEAGASTGELLAAVDAVPAIQTGSENATTVSISTETSSKQAVAASQAAPYKSYRVARGDTLWTIASKFETSVKRIRTLNGLRNSKIYPGQKLMVPGGVSG
ncbi:MAG TPA: LysM peptidoglycan-binding domain-containing protein, partial [Candidatus Eisenbacteria bacterium]|nr:LysM peptidoglycan-binding domain-containing protein [Candidatus Eisenbacteria bacterium]